MKPTSVRSVSLVVAALLVAASLAAQGTQANLYNRLEVAASITTIILNANIRVDGSNGRGTDIDAEDDLGLSKDEIETRFGVRWRPWRRHEFEVGYQFARRSGKETLRRDITFGDSTYPAGIDLGTTLNSDQAFFVYRFAFLAKPRSQVGVAIGAGALLLDVGLDAFGTGGQVQYSQSENVTGPIGSIGAYGRFISGTRWSWEADVRYLRIAIDRFDGRVGEAGAAIRYAAWPKVTFEGGYSLSAVKVDIAQATSGGPGSRSGRIKYSLQTVRLGVVIIP